MGLVVLGLANVWQLQNVQTGSGVPTELRTLGAGFTFGIIPNSLVVFIPIALLILFGLRRTGYGRHALRDRRQPGRGAPVRRQVVAGPARCCTSSRRCWRASPGSCSAALTNTASVTLANSLLLPSVAAAVIGGTSILGGRGGYGGTIVGALILTVRHRAAQLARLHGGRSADPLRRDHRPRCGRLHARDVRVLSGVPVSAAAESPPWARPRRHEHQMGGRRARADDGGLGCSSTRPGPDAERRA